MSFVENPNFNFREIHKQFSQTEAGIRLSNNVRWSRYQGELTNKEWQKTLGYDINNLEHGQLTHGITSRFIDHVNKSDSIIKFDDQEKDLLLLTSLVHDWPEGVTKAGDVMYDKKTSQHEKEELAVIEKVIISALGLESLEVSKQIKDILENKTSKLGMAFNSIERIGYLKTALKSWEKSKIVDNKNTENLKWLTNNVLLGQIPILIEYSFIYPPVDSFLKNKQKIISEAFNNMPNSVFDKYESKEKEKNIDKFNRASTLWKNRTLK